MDSNHRYLGVGQTSSPLDHGINLKMDSSGIAPESSVCRTDVFLLDHEPELFIIPKRKPWDSNPQAGYPAACFHDRFLIRPDDFHNQVAGVGIEPTPPGSEPSIATSSDYPAMNVPRMTRCSATSSQIAGAGIEPAHSWFKATNFYQQKLPRSERGTGGT